jgi:hypothetical protein
MRYVFTLLAAAALASGAHAQSAPPIKPGLWQVQVENDSGQKMPDMSEHLKNMPPEQRKKIEAMMKERGVDMSGGAGGMKICHSKESLDQGKWQGDQGNCKTDILSRSSTQWKWRSVCSNPKAESVGEANFANPENYTVISTTTAAAPGGAPKTIKSTIRSKWLGADCGDLKPIQAPKTK